MQAPYRTLIVARLKPGREAEVSSAFAASDRTELPRLVGVSSRRLFAFHDLYFHLIEADRDPREALPEVRDHPLWHDINTTLAAHISPYAPDWTKPADAMAREFYHWEAR